MEREKKSKNKPMVLVFAGSNGSGKSTITEYFETKNYTNADEIVKSTGTSNEEAALDNIKELIKICDILHVYDNSLDENGFSRIIRKHKDDITIFPNDIWEKDEILNLLE